jgi:hypothetical protein
MFASFWKRREIENEKPLFVVVKEREDVSAAECVASEAVFSPLSHA